MIDGLSSLEIVGISFGPEQNMSNSFGYRW